MRTLATDGCCGVSPYLKVESIMRIRWEQTAGDTLELPTKSLHCFLGIASVADACSQTSRTIAQSSDKVTVK